jgi:hypothetical protein
LKVWKHYLVGQKFELKTDHCGLQHIFTQGNLNARQRRWSELLSEYDFEITYIKGIVNLVARCLECQQVKAEHRHPTGLLQPHAIPESKWEVISMDFIVGLPLTAKRHDSIFVVVDTLTKSAHFNPVRTTYQAPDIARIFIREIVRLHGVPKKIISDRGSMFTGRFWTSF